MNNTLVLTLAPRCVTSLLWHAGKHGINLPSVPSGIKWTISQCTCPKKAKNSGKFPARFILFCLWKSRKSMKCKAKFLLIVLWFVLRIETWELSGELSMVLLRLASFQASAYCTQLRLFSSKILESWLLTWPNWEWKLKRQSGIGHKYENKSLIFKLCDFF